MEAGSDPWFPDAMYLPDHVTEDSLAGVPKHIVPKVKRFS